MHARRAYSWYVSKLRKHPLLVTISSLLGGLVFAATLYNSLTTLVAATEDAWGDLSPNKYEQSETRVSQLIPGMALGRLESIYGEPLVRSPLDIPPSLARQVTPVSRRSVGEELREYTRLIYSDKGYFLIAFVDGHNVVQGYSVQLKNGGFKPPFPPWSAFCTKCRLGQATFARILGKRQPQTHLMYGQAEVAYWESFGESGGEAPVDVILVATNSGSGLQNSASTYKTLVDVYLATSEGNGSVKNVNLGELRSRLVPNLVFITDMQRAEALYLYASGWPTFGLHREEVIKYDRCSALTLDMTERLFGC